MFPLDVVVKEKLFIVCTFILAFWQMLHWCNSRTGWRTCILWSDVSHLFVQWSTYNASNLCHA